MVKVTVVYGDHSALHSPIFGSVNSRLRTGYNPGTNFLTAVIQTSSTITKRSCMQLACRLKKERKDEGAILGSIPDIGS